MLSEDYFGFKIQNEQKKKSKGLRRTQLSKQRLKTCKSGTIKSQKNNIDELRNKYNALNSRNNDKKSRKSKAFSLSPHNFCFHTIKLKNLHYKQQLPSDHYWQIRKKFEKRIIEKARNNAEQYFGKNDPNKIINTQEFIIPNLMCRNLRKGKHHQDFSDSSINKNGGSSSKKILATSKISKIDNEPKSQIYQRRKNQYLPNKQSIAKYEYQLGLCTLKKLESNDDPLQQNINTERYYDPKSQYSISRLLKNGKSLNHSSPSNTIKQEDCKKPKSNDSGMIQNMSSVSISDKFNQQKVSALIQIQNSQYKDNHSQKKNIISDYERIKLLQQKQQQSIVEILKRSQKNLQYEKSSINQKAYQQNKSKLSNIINSQQFQNKASECYQMKNRNGHNLGLQPKIYNNSRIIHNQSNVSSGQSSFFHKVHDFNINNQVISKTSQKINQQYYTVNNTNANVNNLKINQNQSSVIHERLSRDSSSIIADKLSSKFNENNRNSLLSDIIGSSDRPNKTIAYQQNMIYQTGTFQELKKPQFLQSTQNRTSGNINNDNKFSEEQSNRLSKIIQSKVLTPFNHEKVSKNSEQKNYLTSFNLVQSIRFLNNFEEQKIFSQNTNSPTITNGHHKQIQQLINSILEHLQIINVLGQFVKMKDEVYENQTSSIYEFQSFLLFRKYLEQRKKVSSAIQHNKTQIFIFGDQQKMKHTLNKYKNDQKITSLASKIYECNQMIQKTLCQYREQIVRRSSFYNNQLSILSLSSDNLAQLVGLLDEQLQALIAKFHENKRKMNDPEQNAEQVEVISIRAFSLMEIIFLLSSIEGKKVKNLEDDIEPQEFQDYLKAYKHLYDQAVKYLTQIKKY